MSTTLEDNDEVVFIFNDNPPVHHMTIEEHRKKVRQALLIELADIFANTLSLEWRNWEIADFLNSYRANE